MSPLPPWLFTSIQGLHCSPCLAPNDFCLGVRSFQNHQAPVLYSNSATIASVYSAPDRNSLYIQALRKTVSPKSFGTKINEYLQPVLSPKFPQKKKISLGLLLPRLFPSICYKNAYMQWAHRACVGVSFPQMQFGMQVSPSQGSALFILFSSHPYFVTVFLHCSSSQLSYPIRSIHSFTKQQCLRNESRKTSGHSGGIRVPVGGLLTVLIPPCLLDSGFDGNLLVKCFLLQYKDSPYFSSVRVFFFY